MLPSFLLAFREGLEAALIIGIALGVIQKIKRPELTRPLVMGTLSAVIVSILVAYFLNLIGAQFEGVAEEIFEGIVMLSAAGLLTWMIFWMQQQSVFMKQKIELEVKSASRNKTGKSAIFGLAFLAIGREGIELALFLTAARASVGAIPTWLGAVVGLGAATAAGWLLFRSTAQLPLKSFFAVTNILLLLFAAGLVAHGVHELNEAGWIPAIIEHFYDINFILNEKSTVGAIMTALFGYNGNPSLTETISYLLYFVAIGLLILYPVRKFNKLTAEV